VKLLRRRGPLDLHQIVAHQICDRKERQRPYGGDYREVVVAEFESSESVPTDALFVMRPEAVGLTVNKMVAAPLNVQVTEAAGDGKCVGDQACLALVVADCKED